MIPWDKAYSSTGSGTFILTFHGDACFEGNTAYQDAGAIVTDAGATVYFMSTGNQSFGTNTITDPDIYFGTTVDILAGYDGNGIICDAGTAWYGSWDITGPACPQPRASCVASLGGGICTCDSGYYFDSSSCSCLFGTAAPTAVTTAPSTAPTAVPTEVLHCFIIEKVTASFLSPNLLLGSISLSLEGVEVFDRSRKLRANWRMVTPRVPGDGTFLLAD